MIKIAQFGEGNFLRAFADYYFDILNEEGGDYAVSIIKPVEYGTLDKFVKQNNRYTVVLRGMENGKAVEKFREVSVVKEAFPFEEKEKFDALAKDPDLRIVVSNTTEAGIYFSERDTISDLGGSSYPAKLTAFLYERFKAGLNGLYMLPVELIDDNALNLRRCVESYISHWDLPREFAEWNAKENFYCNTLVDRIVSGYPRGEEQRFAGLLGKEDGLITVGEPFGLWVIEKKGEIEKLLKEGFHGVDIIITENVTYYKRRKVRVLNGSHTNMVFPAIWSGADTVYDVMNNPRLRGFVESTLENEIVPFVAEDQTETKKFAQSVIERFENPYINHKLLSISLNSVSKWKARVLPSFMDYCEKHGRIPANMAAGLSYLIHTYRSLYEKGGAYYFNVNGKPLEMKDDKEFLTFFINGGTLAEFLSANIWGVNLNEIGGLADTLRRNLEQLGKGVSLL